ncbi:MAG TPA: MFS transporter [Acidiferrobacterales bacterium]|nr:MFS transporter [Acidiferrobacterales bacterium]
MFRALQTRNYRLYFFGQGVSLIGTWMQQVALSWLIYRLTNSEFLLGLTAFASQIPSLIVTPLAGALADRMNRHKLLIVAQVLAMIQAFLLAGLTLSGAIDVVDIILLGILLGVINALDMPTRQAFLLEMVEKPENLSNAIALHSSVMNAARLVGPALAGAAIALFGEGMCFLVNAVSYIAVIIALFMMRVSPRPRAAHKAPLLAHMQEGFRYAFGFSPIRALILYIGAVSLVGMPYVVLMPVFAKNILHGDAQTLGWLMGAAGFGALVAALLLARRKRVLGLGQWILTASGIFGLGLIAFSFSRSLPLSLVIIAFVGFGMMIQLGATNIILQTIVDEDKRGRVMSLFTMAFLGLAPFGSLLAGSLGEKIGVPTTLLLSGVLCLLAALWLFIQLPKLKREARPVYVAKGIIDEVPAPIPDSKS